MTGRLSPDRTQELLDELDPLALRLHGRLYPQCSEEERAQVAWELAREMVAQFDPPVLDIGEMPPGWRPASN